MGPESKLDRGDAVGDAAAGGGTISQAGERRSSRIESLRALAALAVLMGHVVLLANSRQGVAPADGGGLGVGERLLYGGGFAVFLFFGLTGYLLFWPFVREKFGSGDAIDLRRYAVNRALRILPLYFAVVLVVLLVQYPDAGVGTWLHFLTFTENFSHQTVAMFVGPAWSLVVELHFYVLLPVIAWLLALVSGGSIRRAAVILAGIGLASLVIREVTVYRPSVVDALWRYNLPATFLFFVPGMLLAMLRLEWERSSPGLSWSLARRSDAWILASLPLTAVVLLWSYNVDWLLGISTFLIVGACVLPLEPGPLTRALAWRPLAILGVASYSLYLWHFPLLDALTDGGVPSTFLALALVAVPLAIAVALISYRAIESPFLRLRRQWVSRARSGRDEGLAQVDDAELGAGAGNVGDLHAGGV